MTPLTVMIMEPDPWFLRGLLTVLAGYPEKFEVIGVTANLADLRQRLHERKANILLSDAYGGGENLEDFFRFRDLFYQSYPRTTWLMWSDGLSHFLPGLSPHSALPVCVQKTLSCADLKALLLMRYQQGHQRFIAEYLQTEEGAYCHLTQKELLVINALAHGELQKQLARRVGRSEKTISAHKAKALRKLGVQGDRLLFHHQSHNRLLDILRYAGMAIPHSQRIAY